MWHESFSERALNTQWYVVYPDSVKGTAVNEEVRLTIIVRENEQTEAES